jgi:hypothetical protein
MASLKQIEANRRNAEKSTGPSTPAGKTPSSMNALKTGLYAKSLIIKGEKLENLETLIREYYAQYHPDNPDFRDLVDELIAAVWQVRRLLVTEVEIDKHLNADLWNSENIEFPRGKVAIDNSTYLAVFQRRLDAARRARDRARLAIREYLQQAAPLARRPLRAISLKSNPLTPNWLRSLNPVAHPAAPPADPAPTPSEPAPHPRTPVPPRA